MSEESDLEKSEAPTPTKQEKAREKGQIPRSRELTSMLVLATGLSVLWIAGGFLGRRLSLLMQEGFSFGHTIIGDERGMLRQLFLLVKHVFWTLFPIFGTLVIVAIAAPLIIGGLIFSVKSLKPDITRVSPIKGFKRIFSTQALAELLKGVLKATLIGCMTGWFLWHNWQRILSLTAMSSVKALGEALYLIIQCGLMVAFALLPMVGFDIFYQIWSNQKKLRMTKQEIRDEFKEQEGDPQLKARIRQRQRAIAQSRMMSDVPKADVIITNPTHFAVALQYDQQKMSAPTVLAKGAGFIALRIRELGDEYKIPILEAPPLARALYKHSEIGQPIPATLYAAVAEVLVWVYQLRRWKREGGEMPPVKPHNLPVPDSLNFEAATGETDGNV